LPERIKRYARCPKAALCNEELKDKKGEDCCICVEEYLAWMTFHNPPIKQEDCYVSIAVNRLRELMPMRNETYKF